MSKPVFKRDRCQKIFDKLSMYRVEEYPGRFGYDSEISICITKDAYIVIEKRIMIDSHICGPVWEEINIMSKYSEIKINECHVKSFKKGAQIIDTYIEELKNIPDLETVIKQYIKKSS